MIKLFVYGTLMKGEPLDIYIKNDEETERLGRAKIHGYTLYSLEYGYKGERKTKYYPVAVLTENRSHFIDGEVWSISEDKLKELIEMEQEAGLFLHTAVTSRRNRVYFFACTKNGLEFIRNKFEKEEEENGRIYRQQISHIGNSWKEYTNV